MVFKKKEWRPFEEAREFARSLNLRNAVEWRQYCKSGKDGVPKSNDIPSAPDVIYKNDWNGWFDWLGNEDRVSALKGRKMPERTEEHRRKIGEALKGRKRTEEHKKKMSEAKKKSWRPFEEAREFTRSLKLRSEREWKEYSKTDERPDDIPTNPNITYRDDGWNGWVDWLGNKNRVVSEETRRKMSEANKGSWRPFEEAREFTRSLNLRGSEEWFQYCKSGKDGKPRPDDIPSNPDKAYKNNGWKDWVDWLGNEELA